MEKAGWTLDDLFLTRGSYDVVVISSANDFEKVGAINMIMSTGAFDEAAIIEETDFNRIANKVSEFLIFYKSPNSLNFKLQKNFKQIFCLIKFRI